MKKVLFSLALVVAGTTAFSQVNKGQWLVGGNMDFTASKNGDYKANTFEFAPNAGYFFIDNLAGGLKLNTNLGKSESGNTETKSTGFSIAPFIRYYFLPAAEKINVFADAAYGFGSNTTKVGTVKTEYNVTGFNIAAGPAIF